MKKLLFLLTLIPAFSQAATVQKDLSIMGNREVVWVFEYDDVTTFSTATPLKCINTTNQNAAFKYSTFGNSTNNQVVCAAHTNTITTPFYPGSIGLIAITNVSKDDFDKMQGSFVWPL